ncbi:uncharacterized protein LOC112988249 isoform X5 [Dromaius novaehollandiae]|uniref:uncharacterized protein LOC112988249 isoform X5 n=1 Tax=Dromaius novaehollandiae TaxID=8790 RepID=UPI000E1F2C8E|nr:uncharacterized protein LOC112988249 isoform X5 [Dromaius novaehollandiae]
MALTAPPPRRALLSAADSLLLLLLGAAAGSSHFLDKTQLTKKGDAHLKQEGIIRIHNSVAPSEPMKITSIPDVPQTPHQILGKENSTVPVYVPINSKGLILKCLTEKLLKQGINHPEYQWVGPMGLITKDPCESSDCENSSSCIKKAYTKIHQFLRVLRSQDHNQQMHYIPGSLTGLKIDHCKPGFGKNISNSTVCTECCIACPPGRISAEYNTVCTLCPPGSYNEKYGQTACKSCPKQHTTVRKGAKTASDCHRTLHIWIVFLVIPTGVIVVVLTSWVIIQLCCRRRLAVQYIEAEAELKTKLKTFANLATDAEIQAQRRKLRSPAKYDRKHLPKTKSGCLQEESRALLSNVTVTETSTPFGSDHFPDYTWPNKVETSFEEGISETTLGEE